MSGPGHEPGEGPDIVAMQAGETPEADASTGQTSPASSSRPEDFRLAGEAPRVMRLSRKTLAMIGLVAGLGIGGSLIYALRTTPPPQTQNLIDTNNRAKSDLVTSAAGTYDKVPRLGSALPGDLGRPILSAQQNGQTVPVPAMAGTTGSDPRFAAAEQARQRVVQERDTARRSQIFSAGASGARDGGGAASAGAAAAGQTAMTGTTNGPSSTAQSGTSGTGGNGGTSSEGAKRAFMAGGGNRTIVSAERIVEPASSSIVQAGSVIAAVLITGIRSDLPGQITAQVTQNVYDSPTGRILLIPQGSRLIGEYDSEITAGQTRVLLAWDRLILPGGRSILLDRQPGGDASGFAGLQDKTNYHWGNMLRAAAISTLLGVGTEMATDNNDALVQALRYGTQDTINQLGKQLVQREMNVAPTLTIRPGYPLRVILTRDLVVEAAGEGGKP